MKKRLIIVVFVFMGGLGVFFFEFPIRGQRQVIPEVKKNNHSLQNGDIIFQVSKSSQSKAIQLATKSKYSHVGIIFENEGQYYVYEAIQPVTLTRLNEWISRGENSHFVVKRLKNSEDVLTLQVIENMKKVGEKYKGKDYDIFFEWSDDRIYCSELVWKIYKEGVNVEIGNLQELREFDLTANLVKTKIKERFGEAVPLNEKVISPAAIFDSEKLKTVEISI